MEPSVAILDVEVEAELGKTFDNFGSNLFSFKSNPAPQAEKCHF